MTIGPKDLFDTLASLDWTERFESFDEDELRRLRLYDSLATELGQRSFFRQPQRLSVKVSPEESYERLEHAGEDSLRSMVMTFRQLWMMSEPAQFETVRGMLRRHAKLASRRLYVVVLLDELGRRFREARRAVRMKDVWVDDPVGEPIRVYRAAQVVDDWLYSGPLHTDEARQQRVSAWSRTGYEWSLVKSITEVAGVMWELQLVVRGALGSEVARPA